MAMVTVTMNLAQNGMLASIARAPRPVIDTAVQTTMAMDGPTITMNAHHWRVCWTMDAQTAMAMAGLTTAFLDK